ncbi:MAG: V-type ATP synthase subunit I [Thermoplasmatota archaeon]
MGFFPARMTRLLVGGHKQHLAGVIEALHAEGAVHLEDYEDPTGTTSIGSPLPAGANASEQLVKVRGLLKALSAEDVAPAGPVDPGHTLAQAEHATTAIVDRANAHRADWVALETEETTLAPYRGLDIELSALTGLTSVKVYIGQARADPTAALQSAGLSADVQAVPGPAGFAVAAIVPTREAAAAEKALQSSGFTSASLPAGRSGTPALRLAAIEAEKSRLQSALASSEADLATLRADWAPRLASAEAALATEVEKTQAPLKFAVTTATFHVEGWIPRSAANRVKNALAAKFGDSLYVEDLGDAPRDGHAHGHTGSGPGHALAADTHASVPPPADASAHADAHDEHHAVEPEDEPPIHLENPKPARPYEWMLSLLASPRYGEIDPSKLMLVFFPLFFGLMVGDVIVGAAIIAFGWYLKSHKVIGIGGPAVGRALVAGGILSVIIGAFVFGEALGIHFVVGPDQEAEGEMSWEQVLGLHIPFETESHGFLYKTGSPDLAHGAEGAAGTHETGTETNSTDAPVETGLTTHQEHAEEVEGAGNILAPAHHTHLSVGGIVNLGYYSKLADALALLVWSLIIGIVHIILGLILGVRNVWAAHGFTLAIQEKGAWLTLMGGAALAVLGSGMLFYVGIGVVVASLALLWMGAAKVLGQGFIALLEIPSLIGNIVSYTRLAAIGASKAGLGLALGVICFETLGGGPVGWILYVVLFVGIILLAVLSAGLQSLRLQFVEFFGKFYTGGGRPYVPFGRRAT